MNDSEGLECLILLLSFFVIAGSTWVPVILSVPPLLSLSWVTKRPGDTQLNLGRAVWKECEMSSGKPAGI